MQRFPDDFMFQIGAEDFADLKLRWRSISTNVDTHNI